MLAIGERTPPEETEVAVFGSLSLSVPPRFVPLFEGVFFASISCCISSRLLTIRLVLTRNLTVFVIGSVARMSNETDRTLAYMVPNGQV